MKLSRLLREPSFSSRPFRAAVHVCGAADDAADIPLAFT
jgi:hypothetical protein